jgi:signal transduction histidine kinase
LAEKQSRTTKAAFQSGAQPFRVRARILMILGEQLIRDEVAAVFELVKNSYDADATQAIVTLDSADSPSRGKIVVWDDGIGMTREVVKHSWLEIGTTSKFSPQNRVSPGGRVYLGEKGIGRFAVHKLGRKTELTTRAAGFDEVDVTVDWAKIEEGGSEYLEDIPVHWDEHEPHLFTGKGSPKTGTRISITNLQTTWTQEMIDILNRNLSGVGSPFAGLKGFSVKLEVQGGLTRPLLDESIDPVLETAPYKFDARVDAEGNLVAEYSFYRSDLPELKREAKPKVNLLDPTKYPRRPTLTGGREKPRCGPFSFRLYAWDLRPEDKRAAFGDIRVYNQRVKPNAGIRLFRDGFRILPYGNPDDDWLSLDARRVGGTFEAKISRNQIFGTIEITIGKNRDLRDKSDRGGLINNDAFRDFVALIHQAISVFERYRYFDHNEVEKAYGRTRADRLARIQKGLDEVVEELRKSKGAIGEKTSESLVKKITDMRTEVGEIVQQIEEPLLVAAAVGLSYMVPSHEALRDLGRINSLLKANVPNMPEGKAKSELQKAWRLARRTDELVSNLANIFKRAGMKEVSLGQVARQACDLLKERIDDAGIKCHLLTSPVTVRGSERLLTTLIMNLLDNSIYWLGPLEPDKRQINVIVGTTEEGRPFLVVSDSGPGLPDDIDYLAQPYQTTKPEGMGLGLYIAKEVASAHGGRLLDFSQFRMKGLLKGASVGMTFPMPGAIGAK